jgi:hypothetical protein
MDRRKFIANITRWSLAGGIISVSGLLIHRRQNTTGDDCSYFPVCTHCTLIAGCTKTTKKIRLENGKTNKN